MRDCLIVGCGRSGTSMLGGILHDAGYYMGDDLYGPDSSSNPKGFYESPVINAINEKMLSQFDGATTPYVPMWRCPLGVQRLWARRFNPHRYQRWLCILPSGFDLEAPGPKIRSRIDNLSARSPFAYKDPRFSYTLPAWEPSLPRSTVFLCIFRSPQVTVRSIRTECANPARGYLADLRMNDQIAYAVWIGIYQSVLRFSEVSPERFLFVHYDQIFDGSALPALSERLDAPLSVNSIDPRLRRTAALGDAPPEATVIYQRLLELTMS